MKKIKLNHVGARTSHLWGKTKTALFCNRDLTLDEAKKLLISKDEKVVELLYGQNKNGWKSLLKEEALS